MEGTDEDAGQWLLATIRAVLQATTDREETGQIADAVTDSLGEAGRFAWIGVRGTRPGRVRVRAASGTLEPPVVLSPGERPAQGPSAASSADEASGKPTSDSSGTDTNGPTHRSLENGLQQSETLAEDPEYRTLRREHGIPEATSGVSVPLVDADHQFGVLHWYTDRDLSQQEAVDVVRELGGLVTDALRGADCRRELERERERLEGLRSTASHDLGNPLNLGSGRLELARTECESEHLDHVERAFDQIDEIVDERLTLVEAGKPIEANERVQIDEIAGECWEHLGGDPASLTVPPLRVRTDSERLRRILTELFRNVLVHTDDAEVWLEPLAEGGFAVVDSGEGIADQHREFVFDRGFSTEDDREGNGLTIVDEVVGANGWELELVECADGTRIEIYTDRW